MVLQLFTIYETDFSNIIANKISKMSGKYISNEEELENELFYIVKITLIGFSIIYASPKFYEVTQYFQEDIIGENPDAIISNMAENFKINLQNNNFETSYSYNSTHYKANKQKFISETKHDFIRNKNGIVKFVVFLLNPKN